MIRKGMTLLEVVVALSLSALLLIALNGVLSGLFRQKKRTAEVQYREWAYEMDRVFWNDLAQARGVALNDGVLLMTVPATRRLDNGQSTEQSVAYQLLPSSKDHNRLTRSVYLGQERSVNLERASMSTAVKQFHEEEAIGKTYEDRKSVV